MIVYSLETCYVNIILGLYRLQGLHLPVGCRKVNGEIGGLCGGDEA